MVELEYGQTVELRNGDVVRDITTKQTPIGTTYAGEDYVWDSQGQCLSHGDEYDVISTQDI